MRIAIAAALLLLTSCGKTSEDDLPTGPKSAEEGYDQVPPCGTAFLFELTATMQDSSVHCPAPFLPLDPAALPSPRYIRIDWKHQGGSAYFTDGNLTIPSNYVSKSGTRCGIDFSIDNDDGSEDLSLGVDLDATQVRGSADYHRYLAESGFSCETKVIYNLRPIPPK